MRYILVAAAAIAVSGFVALTSVRAEPVFQSGGPIKVGEWCKVSTDTSGMDAFGYMKPCDDTPHYARRHTKQKAD
jgi:hypothetical protein